MIVRSNAAGVTGADNVNKHHTIRPHPWIDLHRRCQLVYIDGHLASSDRLICKTLHRRHRPCPLRRQRPRHRQRHRSRHVRLQRLHQLGITIVITTTRHRRTKQKWWPHRQRHPLIYARRPQWHPLTSTRCKMLTIAVSSSQQRKKIFAFGYMRLHLKPWLLHDRQHR